MRDERSGLGGEKRLDREMGMSWSPLGRRRGVWIDWLGDMGLDISVLTWWRVKVKRRIDWRIGTWNLLLPSLACFFCVEINSTRMVTIPSPSSSGFSVFPTPAWQLPVPYHHGDPNIRDSPLLSCSATNRFAVVSPRRSFLSPDSNVLVISSKALKQIPKPSTTAILTPYQYHLIQDCGQKQEPTQTAQTCMLLTLNELVLMGCYAGCCQYLGDPLIALSIYLKSLLLISRQASVLSSGSNSLLLSLRSLRLIPQQFIKAILTFKSSKLQNLCQSGLRSGTIPFQKFRSPGFPECSVLRN